MSCEKAMNPQDDANIAAGDMETHTGTFFFVVVVFLFCHSVLSLLTELNVLERRDKKIKCTLYLKSPTKKIQNVANGSNKKNRTAHGHTRRKTISICGNSS